MENLKDILNTDLKLSLVEKNQIKTNTIRSIITALVNDEKNSNTKTDSLKILSQLEKQRLQSITEYKSLGRDDLAEVENLELEVIIKYLPKKLSESELISLLNNFIIDNEIKSPKEIGKIMAHFNKEYQGQFNGKELSILINQNLTANAN